MCMARIQVVIDEAERERFRACAKAEGLSLSEWLRGLGRERVAASQPRRLATRDDLLDFFDAIKRDHRAGEREEDWETTKARFEDERYQEVDPLGVDS